MEKRFSLALKRVNTRFYLWLLEHAKAGVVPHSIPPWLDKITADVIYDAYRPAFRLGWQEGDQEVQRAYIKRRRMVGEFARKRTPPPPQAVVEVHGHTMGISMPEAVGAPVMHTFLVGGVLTADGTWTYPYPEEGLRWYAGQAVRLARETSEAKLSLAQEVMRAATEEGKPFYQTVSALAEALRPFGLQGGIGTQVAPEGAGAGLRAVSEYPRYRLEAIVRTETMHIYNAGRYLRQVGEDIITGWEWSAILDEATCEECEERDGIYIAKGEEIGESPPSHPACRCVLIPVLDVEEPPEETPADLSEEGQMADGWGDPLRREWTAEEA